ncbi:unnamed protein product [Polarella glacialis]|nr:unnamed protein product [Polarella glacialis]
MKLSMVLLMVLLAGPLQSVANFVLGPFLAKPELKLLVVMLATPIAMNALQFWMTDNFIKKRDTEENGGQVGEGGATSDADHLPIGSSSNELEHLLPDGTSSPTPGR